MPNANTPKLNNPQLIILSSAWQREDGLAVLPEGVKPAPGNATVIKLTKLGFLKQVRVKRDQPLWWINEADRRIGFAITKAGADAIGVGNGSRSDEEDAPAQKRRGTTAEQSNQPPGKPGPPGGS